MQIEKRLRSIIEFGEMSTGAFLGTIVRDNGRVL